MITKKDLVSIGMPVYNGEKYLRESLDSLLSQNYKNFELIISDNASTDNTAEICREYKSNDNRIRFYQNDNNIGSLLNFKKVFDLSNGKYFMWASCHDLWDSTFVSKCADILNKEDSVVLCNPLADWIDTEGESLGPTLGNIDTRGLGKSARCHIVLWGFQNGYPLQGLMKASAIKKVPLALPVFAPDMLFLFELSLIGEFAYIPEVLFHFRKFPDSMEYYTEKMVGFKTDKSYQKKLYWRMTIEYIRAITRQYRCRSAWPGLMLSVLYGLWIKKRDTRRIIFQK
ncbi:glycosyltransferase family 2 protein [Thermodesulfobacteriota bacterium]